MSFKVGWSDKVQNAIAAPRLGKLAVACSGFTVKNRYPSYPGFNGYSGGGTEFLADSTRTQVALIKWLTSKVTGVTILALVDGVAEREYGSEWQTCMATLGNTVTTSGTLSGFGGYDPLDFDLLCMLATLSGETYRGMSDPQDKVDYILANRGAIMGTISPGANVWAAYGFIHTGINHPDTYTGVGGHHVHYITYGPEADPHDGWQAQYPFTAYPQLGAPGSGGSWGSSFYAYSMPTNTYALGAGTNSRGGSSVLYHCECAEDYTQYEDHRKATGDTGALGLWWL